MAKGAVSAIVIIVVVVILIVAAILFRGTYQRNTGDYGTWSSFTTTVCLNENQPCTTTGTSQKFRTCTPNPTTGFGCIDSNGDQKFDPEVIESSCTPICFSAQWSATTQTPCKVYTNASGTTLAPVQTCRAPGEFTFTKTTKTCTAKDASGVNACVKSDNSIAAIGEAETTLTPCSSIPDCFPGTWDPCGPPQNVTSQDCGGTTSECGEVILGSIPATCTQIIAGIPTQVATSNCNPVDDPGPCVKWCFNYPCTSYPAGFTNVASYLGSFLELIKTPAGTGLEPFWNHVQIGCNANPVATTSSSLNVVITTPALHTMLVGQLVDVQGIPGPALNGIPIAELNGLRMITATTGTSVTFQVTTPATSTGSGGGILVTLEQDPEGAAMNNQDVIGAFGPIDTYFGGNGVGFRVRLRIIPSQAEVAAGAFYLIAHLPHNGQSGLVSWSGSNLVISTLPVITLGETLDDVVPRPDLFVFTEAATPQKLKLYTLPGPVLTDIFCGVSACINISSCPNFPVSTVGEICT